MAEIKEGLLIDPKVSQHIIPAIQRGIMAVNNIKTIVIHQTHGYNAQSAIDGWKKGRKVKNKIIYPGTHFIIDRGTGSVVEGNKITKYNGIDGNITQTSRVDRRCDHVAKLKKGIQVTATNSLGIELVGRWTKNDEYTDSSAAQVNSATWLVTTLISLITGISSESIYAHGAISNGKEPSEGVKSLEQIKNKIIEDKITIYSFIPLNLIPNVVNNTLISKIITKNSESDYI